MRGNRDVAGRDVIRHRSIPAYAGEPPVGAKLAAWRGVYPRVCGGTVGMPGIGVPVGGLSPRMRGNLCYCLSAIAGVWSIPAYAGEPMPAETEQQQQPVYPRVCGGTVASV